MSTEDRVDSIKRAQNFDDLHDAMQGFLEEAEGRYPALAQAATLKACIGGSAFAQAVGELKQYQSLTGETYPDVHRVVEAAAAKHAQLSGTNA